jgi:acetylornithine deacetylase/succinyl-diaminopimelate desuccinylase-like protein
MNVSDGPNSDDSHNNVPGESIIQIDVRFESDYDLDRIKEGIRETIEKAIDEASSVLGKAEFEVLMEKRTYGPSDFSQAKLLQTALRTYTMVNSERPNCSSSVFGTDASFYITKGVFGPDKPNIIIAGPGMQRMAHTANESVAVKNLEKYSEIYTYLVLMCMEEV